jgi:hypothetical protein
MLAWVVFGYVERLWLRGRLCGRRRRESLKPVFYSALLTVCVLVLTLSK